MRRFPYAVPMLLAITTAASTTVRAQHALEERKPGLQVVEPDEHDRELRMTPVVRAVQKAADSVVSIYLNRAVNIAGNQVTEGQGSGVILDDTGFVITNWHVIAMTQREDGYSVVVRLKDGRTRAARVLSSSPTHDLALLLMQLENGEKVTPVAIGRSSDLMVGETVIAIGNPQGHANTVTSGVLSATGRSITVQTPDSRAREYTGLLQTDAAINQGNSGGALLDITGRLIGINNAMAMGAENIGFAIPVDTVREVFESELLSSDSFAAMSDSAWLGMDVTDKRGQLVVASVVDGSPAATSGIRAGDVLLEIAGKPAKNRLDYARAVLTAPAQHPIALRLQRGSRELDASPRPWTRAAGLILGMSGMEVEEVAAGDDRSLAESVTRAFYRDRRVGRVPLYASVLRVRSVQPDSPAAALRIAPHDVLIGAIVPMRGGFGTVTEGDLRIESSRDLATMLRDRQGSTLKLVVLRGEDDLVGTLDVRKVD